MHKKDINEYIKYIYSLERKGIKYDLTKIARLLDAIGNPHHSQNYIHIAGTNGKGGTASFFASILTEHGLKTGLFTSPHILRFNERIRINGKPIPDSYIETFLNKNLNLIKNIKASFFEINTALALKYFSDKKTDISVIETGLGGRLDATNIIKPKQVIITQLGLEHTDMLGHTLRKITIEKLGIVKPNTDVVVSDDHKELRYLFLQKADRSRLFFINDIAKISLNKQDSGQDYTVAYKGFKTRYKIKSILLGKYHIKNAITAIYGAIRYLSSIGITPDSFRISKGIENVVINSGYHGRFENIFSKGITYIFDVAHNPDAISNSMHNLVKSMVDVIIFGLMNDKDYKSIIKSLLKGSDKIIFTRPTNKRSQDPNIMFDYAIRICKLKKGIPSKRQYFCIYDLDNSLTLTRNIVGNKGRVLIIGSFFLVSEAIKTLRLQKYFA